MSENTALPRISWSMLLRAAPHFSQAIYDAIADTPINQLAPKIRAICYWDIFCSEVCNGGVAQYLYNQSITLPQFELAPEFVAEHPLLVDALPFMRQVHSAWQEVATDVLQSHQQGEWPEEFFNKYIPVFDNLQTEFFRVSRKISCRIDYDIIQSPHDYFLIAPMDAASKSGVSYVEKHSNEGILYRFRFVDGFPVGPNIFELKNGECIVIRFTAGRDLLIIEQPDYTGCSQQTFHFPSLLSAEWHFDGRKRLQHFQTRRALWHQHGLDESYNKDGSINSCELSLNDTKIRSEYYSREGKIDSEIQNIQQQEYKIRYWPSGSVNTRLIIESNSNSSRERYLQCCDENGKDLLLNGTGRLFEVLTASEDGTVLRWRECDVFSGYLQGIRIWKERGQEVQSEMFHEGYIQH